jgi:hypothetical protein
MLSNIDPNKSSFKVQSIKIFNGINQLIYFWFSQTKNLFKTFKKQVPVEKRQLIDFSEMSK